MSDPCDPDPALFDLGPGLNEFYSSQATLMLAQYENIKRLLGPTTDYTAPGTHCEILLRDFLRSHLPSRFSLGKGFIYGRRPAADGDAHCPEIDVLVHDTHNFRPLIQIEEFAIVQARAARAAIQVKRRMDGDQLSGGLRNMTSAKEHWSILSPYQGSRSFATAVVFFDERHPGRENEPSSTYKKYIRESYADPATWDFAPDFIGSLKHHFYRRSSYNINHLNYDGYPACVNGQNIAVQFLLWIITHIVSGYGTQPPMDGVPQMMTAYRVDSFEIAAPIATTGGVARQQEGDMP